MADDETVPTIAPSATNKPGGMSGMPSGANLTLRNSPTGGAPGEHSPYYRRLLSAGYKGYLQGVIGGSTLYGIMGAGIGALIATPLALGWGMAAVPMAWLLIPGLAGMGLAKGASTFGNIGSIAAINAESAEMLEERRYLLERYYSLPDTPEYKKEAEEISRLIAKQHEVKPPRHVFHWKTVLVAAVLGAAIAVGLMYAAPFALTALHLEGALALIGLHASEIAFTATPAVLGVSGAIGALAGTMIGLDRYYVRRWLDFSENLLTDPEHIKEALQEKAQDAERLVEASPTKGAESTASRGRTKSGHGKRDIPGTQQPVVHVDAPSTMISGAQLESRLADIEAALGRPVA